MSLILSGTDGLSDVDGSASTPAIRGTDTNTGIFFPAADTIAFAEGGAEVARFDSNGNLLLGTTSASGFDSGADNVIVGGGSGNTGMTIYSGTTGVGAINFADGTSGSAIYAGGITYNHNDNRMDFSTTDGSGRMRINSDGNLLVGTTTVFGSARATIRCASGNTALSLQTEANSGTQTMVYFADTDSDTCGTITVNATANTTAYNTSSDYRLKENVQPMTGALEKVSALNPVVWKWKHAPMLDGQGFIAHELAEVVPDAVSGEKDAVDAEGNPKYQGIDTSFLVATLTAALQEAHGLIKDLQARVDVLESK
jgi:hypothetical protein